MSGKAPEPAVTSLLSRAHSPTTTTRIYTEKIYYRPLLLRPTTPSPPPPDARAARHATRVQAKSITTRRATPLSSRALRRLGLHAVPRKTAQGALKYATFLPLKVLWEEYVRELLGAEMMTMVGSEGKRNAVLASAAGKLVGAEFVGAEVEVCRSRCVGRVGTRGIVVRDGQRSLEVVTEKGRVVLVPKEGTTFRVKVSVEKKKDEVEGARKENETEENGETNRLEEDDEFVFEIMGDQFMYRAADRANRKFKNHYLKNL